MEIKDLINKIKWDKREIPEQYSFFYVDRISGKMNEIGFNDIKRIEGTFIIVEREGKEIEIPMHRIREVRKEGKLVWRR